ncbi:Odorant receptor 312 [Nylanderia fulva]|uniref:Odorant receptor 312 n=1 Tax=Nylanderia fulva TaxID=613905 RepID=A0A6G1LRE8_9HYME|nr:Odorant receptor 312 [Nylanderia fulva]
MIFNVFFIFFHHFNTFVFNFSYIYIYIYFLLTIYLFLFIVIVPDNFLSDLFENFCHGNKCECQFALLTCFCLMFFIVFQFLSNFLDVIIPLNYSREHSFVYSVEYFVDQKRYFYPILIHGLLACSAGSIAVISTGCMLAEYSLHICAMLKIASYRLEHMTDKISPTLSANRDHIIQKRIINAVDIHRRAIEFAEFMLSNFMIIYLILIGVGISSLTINLFQLLHLLMLNDMNGVLECIILIAAHLIYLFFSNLDGQLITDHNTDVFKTTYTTRWYTVSLKTQKLLFLIMQRSTKNYYFIVGGVFAASVESFASIT